MKVYAIPRGIIYHRIRDEALLLMKSLFAKVDDKARIETFQKNFAEYMGAKFCLAYPYARTAIYYTLKSLNLPKGAEVLMPPITIKAILDVVLELNLKPVFVDIELNSLCFEHEKLVLATSNKTKVAIITYLFGMVPDVERMIEFLKSKEIFVIEDFSQCLDGRFDGKKLGTFGDVGIYSASSIKTLDTFGGGILICDQEDFYNKLKAEFKTLLPPKRSLLIKKIIVNLIRNIATSRKIFHFLVFPILKFASFFYPQAVIKHTGMRDKNRITELPQSWFASYTSLQADFGNNQLTKVEKENLERISNVERIKSHAPHLFFPDGEKKGYNVYWQLIGVFKKNDETQRKLQRNGIDTSSTSLELISKLKSYPNQGLTPNAEKLYFNGLFIPSFPGLSHQDVEYIGLTLNKLEDEC